MRSPDPETPQELIERCKDKLRDIPSREPEDWPIPISKADLRALIRLADQHIRDKRAKALDELMANDADMI